MLYSPESGYRGELKSIYLERASEPELGTVTFLYGDPERRALNYVANQIGTQSKLSGRRIELDSVYKISDTLGVGATLWNSAIRTPVKPGIGHFLSGPLFMQTGPDFTDSDSLNRIMNLELIDPFLTRRKTIFSASGIQLSLYWNFFTEENYGLYITGKLGGGKEAVSSSLVYKSDLYLGVKYKLTQKMWGFLEAGQTGYSLVVEKSNQSSYGDGRLTNPGMNSASINMGVGFSP